MKTAKEIINSKFLSFSTITKDSKVIDAFTMMETLNIDYVVVMDGKSCIGILSEVDYMHQIILARRNPYKTTVKEIISNQIYAVDHEEPVHRCLELMDTFKIRHLLVFDSHHLKGVITLHDLMLAAFEENIDHMLQQDEADYFLSCNISSNPQRLLNLYD